MCVEEMSCSQCSATQMLADKIFYDFIFSKFITSAGAGACFSRKSTENIWRCSGAHDLHEMVCFYIFIPVLSEIQGFFEFK